MFCLVLEKEEGKGKEREKYPSAAFCIPPTKAWVHNPWMCPDLKWMGELLVHGMTDIQSTEPQWPEPKRESLQYNTAPSIITK